MSLVLDVENETMRDQILRSLYEARDMAEDAPAPLRALIDGALNEALKLPKP